MVKSQQKKTPVKKAIKTKKKESYNTLPETRHLYLLRHGKASKDYDAYVDFERPLIKRGKKDSKQMKKWLASNHIMPDLILCSPSVRTKETLEKVIKAFDNIEVLFVESLYLASADEILHLLQQVVSERRNILVIGHNPGFEDFVTNICDIGQSNDSAVERIGNKFPTSSIACIEIEGKWSDLGKAPAYLTEFIRPVDLK